jgi:hypothetical protein
MASKQRLRTQLLPFLIYPYLVSFVLFLYLPHTNIWWRVATLLLVAFSYWSFVDTYRRRVVRKRERSILRSV